MKIINPQTHFKNFHELINAMRERPGMYLGRDTISNLHSFFVGFGWDKNDPHFDGFIDYCGLFYGKYTQAGWHGLILADCYGHEEEALQRFFQMYDWYCENPKPIDSRCVLHKLLHIVLIDVRVQSYEKDDKTIWKLTNWLLSVPIKLSNVSYSGYLSEYDSILQEIFDEANSDTFLKKYLLGNFEKLNGTLYEPWQNENDLIYTNKSHENYNEQITNRKFVEDYLAVTPEFALTIYKKKTSLED